MKKLVVCFLMLVLSSSYAYSETIELPKTQQPDFELQPLKDIAVKESGADNSLILQEFKKVRTENKAPQELVAEAPKNEGGLIRIEPEKKKEPVKLQVEENIFNKNFSKTFETGIVKSVKLIGAQDFMFTGFRASNGNSHSLFNNEVGLYGVQVGFRDGTLLNYTMTPFLDAPGYHNFQYRSFEYYLKKPLGKHHYLTVGQQRTPVGFEGCMSAFGLPVGRRSQIGSKYSNICAIGSKVSGKYDRIEYDLGFFDAGRFGKDAFTGGTEFAGLVSFKPIKNTQKYGNLKVGGSYNAGKRDNSYSVYSAHIAYDYKKFHNISEFSSAKGYNGRTNSGANSYGYYTTFLYDVTPKVQAFCRMDSLNSNVDLGKQLCNEYTAGLHYYLKGRKARLTLSYIFADSATKKNDNSKIFTMLELLL